MKFQFILTLLSIPFTFCREVSELENNISRLDSPQDVAKFVSLNRKEIEDKLPMMDDNTRRKIEDSLRNNTNSSTVSSDSNNDNLSYYILLFSMNFLFQ